MFTRKRTFESLHLLVRLAYIRASSGCFGSFWKGIKVSGKAGNAGRGGCLRRGRHATKVRVAIGVMAVRRERAIAERRRDMVMYLSILSSR